MRPASRPTMYFIGVTTGASSIMKLFPHWMEILGADVVIEGIDLPIHASPERYREVVRFIKDDPLSLGALVTTHKIDICNAARDIFDYLDPFATRFSELSSISKNGCALEGHAKDPITCALAMDSFVPGDYWRGGGECLLLGAGGSAISAGYHLLSLAEPPRRVIVTNRSQLRLIEIERIFKSLNASDIGLDFRLAPESAVNDRALAELPPRSLVINATGLGKDRPGSPVTDAAVFPADSFAWEFNYRGELDFARQAKASGARVEDGWRYFLHGWTQVVSQVLHIDITDEIFAEIDRASARLTGRA